MRYQHVCIEAVGCTLPPYVVTSAAIEERLAPVYERLRLPAGRLELMSGIRERRFFEPGTRPGAISAATANRTLDAAGLDRKYVGALIHGSVCRDQMEPATAASVHHALGIPDEAYVLDFSNACLGLLNGMLYVADLIESGRIRAGVVVGTEIGRPLVEGTIDSLLNDPALTRQSIKPAFASLTIGSGSAAIVLCDRRLSRTGNRLLGGAVLSDTAAHELCAGGVASEQHGDDRPRMATDSEALLHAGINLAARCWERFLQRLSWTSDEVSKVFTHQVGRAHRKLLLERLGIPPERDYPVVEILGNTGATALPMAAALGIEHGHLQPGDRLALLGIGSGLSSVMLGMEWHSSTSCAVIGG
ncbi:MAG: 3-oxoacyl-ACP synthase III [Planctomycetaceae bacterium]|nr:3-oxoacyl-ACP synthase III [Planctomycetaceae bacterium]